MNLPTLGQCRKFVFRVAARPIQFFLEQSLHAALNRVCLIDSCVTAIDETPEYPAPPVDYELNSAS